MMLRRNKCDKKCTAVSVLQAAHDFINNDIDLTTVDNIPSSQCENFVKQFSVSIEEIEYIQESTSGQSSNLTWHEMRKGMITASNFKRVCDSVDAGRDPPSLCKTLLGQYRECNAPSLVWGRKKEKAALDLYKRASQSKHKGVSIHKQGLQVCQNMPFIGCSVDGLFACKCKNHPNIKIVEVKCPYSDRQKHPKEVALTKGCVFQDGKFRLQPESPYYHQVQGQMGIYECDRCDLVIYTKQGICVIGVNFDEDFYKSMILKLKSYFISSLLKHVFLEIKMKGDLIT